jgi:hypothetical protein
VSRQYALSYLGLAKIPLESKEPHCDSTERRGSQYALEMEFRSLVNITGEAGICLIRAIPRELDPTHCGKEVQWEVSELDLEGHSSWCSSLILLLNKEQFSSFNNSTSV